MLEIIILLLMLLWIPCSIRIALQQIEMWKINKKRHGKYFPANIEKYGKWFPTRQDKRMYEQEWFTKIANGPQPYPKKIIKKQKSKIKLIQRIKNHLNQPVSQAFKIRKD